ncbi:MAG: hypothetical protein V4736_04740 [Bdellovibrionota bacterium]
MKTNEYPYLKAYKASVLFLALGFGAFVLFSPEKANFQAGKQHEAQQQAQKLAQEILQRKTATKQNGRIPASASDQESEGQIALDPWGNPYKYNTLETDMGIARVVVRTQSSEQSSESAEVQGYAENSGPADAQDLRPEY